MTDETPRPHGSASAGETRDAGGSAPDDSTPEASSSRSADLTPGREIFESHHKTQDPDRSETETPKDPADPAAEGFLPDVLQSADVARKTIHCAVETWLTLHNKPSTGSAGILEMLVHLDRRREVKQQTG